jgi:dTDP-4-amino-4,6-dideoxygalactose transaminase
MTPSRSRREQRPAPAWRRDERRNDPVLSYGRQSISDEDVAEVIRVLEGDFLTQGPEVPAFESALRDATGAEHAVAVANGTCALHLANLALGVGPGTRVLTSPNTFLASATASLHCGADVEFVDIEPTTGNLDLDLLERRLAREPRVSVVTIVHFAGLPCDMERLIALKARFGFRIIEDAAHALGATYRVDGQWYRVGEHPAIDACCLSFHPVKLVTCAEGGALLSGSAEVAERVRRLRAHGIDHGLAALPFADARRAGRPGWLAPMVDLGFNYRLSDVHAALGRSQIARMPELLEQRREIATAYETELEGFDRLARGGDGREHADHLYVVRVEGRDELIEQLAASGIRAQVHYYPVPLQPWFRERFGAQRFPRAEAHARTALSLPLYPGLGERDQTRVVDALLGWRRRALVA